MSLHSIAKFIWPSGQQVNSFSTFRRVICAIVVIAMISLATAQWTGRLVLAKTQTETNEGISVPSGFSISEFANDELATNVYCMTVNEKGQPVVSGPGYIKTLIDSNGDGRADESRLFASLPRNGAQGLMVEGPFLYCTGDQGLLRFRDADQNGVADGPPELILAIKTGGEHDAHAMRRGPDGWLYYLVGNGVKAKPEYFNGQFSPITNPQAGFLMRFSPDFGTREIVAHGFRNAYDFDFDEQGKIYVYDSDGERDISLPWYRPTRVFEIRPGDHAGWVTASWKRPGSFFDMPTVVGRLGRGSPTGVCCYNQEAFPRDYQGALFVADWTFGRVVVFKKNREGHQFDQGNDFAISHGQTGFAVTDICDAKDGALWISVGGRGTRGAIYRVTYASTATEKAKRVRPRNRRLTLNDVLTKLSNNDPKNRQIALESLVGQFNQSARALGLSDNKKEQVFNGLRICLANPTRESLGLLSRILPKLELATLARLEQANIPLVSKGMVQLAMSKNDRRNESSRRTRLLEFGADNFLKVPSGHRLWLLRTMQLALGECGNVPQSKPMFHGYQAKSSLVVPVEQRSNMTARWQSCLNRSFEKLAIEEKIEFARLGAMLNLSARESGDLLLREINDESVAPNDIHWLNCIAKMDGPLNSDQVNKIAKTLVALPKKLSQQERNIDRNWFPRMTNLVQLLFSKHALAEAIIRQKEYGFTEHTYIHRSLPSNLRADSAKRFFEQVSTNLELVQPDQLRVIGENLSVETMNIIRRLAAQPRLFDTAVQVLAKRPDSTSKTLFIKGLVSPDLATAKRSANALRQLGGSFEAELMINALVAIKRLGWDKKDVSVRDSVVALLQQRAQRSFGYRPGLNQRQSAVLDRWAVFLKRALPNEYNDKFDSDQTEALAKRMARINWRQGDLKRGLKLYNDLQCAKCHDGGRALGPRLQGLSGRFSQEDIFRAIVLPSEQVSDRYRAIIIETIDGEIFRGAPIYQSVDGVTLLESSGGTVRINRADIEDQTNSAKSLMPEGLLDQCSDSDWADLHAYLKTL